MSNVPKLRFKEFGGEWEEKKLGNIFKITAGGDIKPENVSLFKDDIFKYPIYANAEKNKGFYGYANIYKIEANVITVAGRGVNLGIAHARKHKFYPIVRLLVLNPKIESNIDFFEYQINNLNMLIESTGVPQLTAPQISKYKVCFPSKPEQEKIASFLTSVNTKIEQLTKKEALLQEYKKGVMNKIFNQEIRFKDDDGSEFPEWEKNTLGEVAKFRRGSFPQPYGLPEWYDDENGMPFIQVYDVDDNMKLKPKTKNKISKLAQPSSVFVEKGSIVLTIQGSIGRIALTQYDAFVDRTLLIFTEYKKPIDKLFFIYLVFLLFEIEKMKAPGGTIKTITKEVLTEFKIQLPCIQEQTKIANFLSSIDKKIELTTKELNSTKEFKKALLQQMFV